MRLCFIADARSPIAQQWIGYFPPRGHDVHVLATSACQPQELPGARIHVLSPLVNRMEQILRGESAVEALSAKRSIWPGRLAGRAIMRFWAPCKWALAFSRAGQLVREIQPDLLHALRIPIEAEIGVKCNYLPFMVSTWGNDFTLYAAKSQFHRYMTRKVLQKASALLSDCDVDIVRAKALGLASDARTLKLPGNGGILRNIFRGGDRSASPLQELGIQPSQSIIVNPRGFRPYVRNDTFFAAIPHVLAEFPDATFVAVGMRDWGVAQRSVQSLGIERSVVLTGALSKAQMADLFRCAALSVSPAEHDGTPNTLLEAMACGCFPICGDLASIREWIVPGRNGLLFDPGNPKELAQAIILGLSDHALRRCAAQFNEDLIASKADYTNCMGQAERFYEEVVSRAPRPVCAR